MYFPTNGGAKEPQNLPNHRVDTFSPYFFGLHILLTTSTYPSPQNSPAGERRLGCHEWRCERLEDWTNLGR